MIFTAVVVTAYEVLLQHFADVSFGAMVFTAILIGLAGAAQAADNGTQDEAFAWLKKMASARSAQHR